MLLLNEKSEEARTKLVREREIALENLKKYVRQMQNPIERALVEEFACAVINLGLSLEKEALLEGEEVLRLFKEGKLRLIDGQARVVDP